MFHQGRILYTFLVSLIMTLICLDPCQWSLMSLITGNKVKKTHKPRYCEKEKDKANKRILRRLSFDNNGLVKPSCRTIALYGPFVFSSPGHRPCELLSWVSVRRPSVR